MKISNRPARTMSWLPVMLLATLMAGCNDSSEMLGGSGSLAGAVLSVTSTVPRAATPAVTGVARNSKITATFNKDMLASTINNTTFTLSCAGTPVAGAVGYIAASRIATFTPAASLAASTTCVATVTTGAQDTTGRTLEQAFAWSFKTAATVDTSRPTVTVNSPATGAAAVATNSRVTATFSETMDPGTLTPASFTLTGPGVTAVSGSVTYSAAARTATFTPTTPATLAAATTFTATITTAATDLAGNGLAGNSAPLPAASNHVWTFTTGAAASTTPPTVTLVNPGSNSTGICLQKSVNATFSTAMDHATLTTTTFTLRGSGPPLGPVLSGTVSYDAAGKIATFNPSAPLAASKRYTATISTGVRNLSGTALAAPRTWSFTTGTQACPLPPIDLGAAAPFGNLGGTAGTTNNGILTVVGGDVSSTATVTSAISGFHDTNGDIYTETGSDMGAVNGRIYSCTVSTLGPTAAAVDAVSCNIATEALSDAQLAFDNLSPASIPGGTDPGAGQLGGLVLAPGVYQAAGGSFMITGSDLTLDAQGDANAVWVFQTASTLTVGGPGAPRSIILVNGAQSKNIYWHVGTSATINAAGGGTMEGNIFASSAVSFSTVGNVALVTLNGRAVGLNASVTMTNTVINVPAQ